MKALIALLLLAAVLPARAADDLLVGDFEGRTYGEWTATGTAFGPGPAHGTLPDQMEVSGFLGNGLVNSYYRGDASTGTLTSPEFTIERPYINFLVGGGYHPGETGLRLLIDGKPVRTTSGRNSEHLTWATWDVTDLQGKRARIEIFDRATGGWGHINVDEIVQSDKRAAPQIVTNVPYDETYRPQFHFTARDGWLNDPNGLVYYAGEYHLFFQHNPKGTEWGNMTWGHAVSRDLVHWAQLPNALEPDRLGTMFSGSAVVDGENTAGFEAGKEKTLAALYTAAGGTSPESQGQPFTQCLAYSTDRGRTWTKFAGNPVLAHIAAENRDPKVVWHAPTRRWIMALYLDGNRFALFSSPDLKAWTKLQDILIKDSSECPDFFELPVKGQPGARKWVLTAANGHYLIGDFDGKKFTPQDGPFVADQGRNYYAVQTYSDVPRSDGRRIQIAWMNGGSYPEMPFNQQMSFPCELTLRRTPEGLRLYRWPVKEIRSLYRNTREWKDLTVRPGTNPLAGLKGDLWDVEMEIETGQPGVLGLRFGGQEARYRSSDRTLTVVDVAAPLLPEKDRVRLRLLIDRTSVEAFGNDGRLSMTSCFLPSDTSGGLTLFAEGAPIRIARLTVRELSSAWR